MPFARSNTNVSAPTAAIARTDLSGVAILPAHVAAARSFHEVTVDDAVRRQTRAIASGDPEALAAMYEEWFDRMYAIARQSTRRDESFCLDVVQDVMMRVIRCVPVCENERVLGAWLRRVVLSCAYDRLRAERRMRNAHRYRARNAVREGGFESRNELHARDEEQLRWLRAELARLGDARVRPLMLRYGAGWTLARMGATLGLSTGAVDGRIQRALDRLRLRAREQRHD